MGLLDMAVGRIKHCLRRSSPFFATSRFAPSFASWVEGGGSGGFLYWKRTKVILFLSIRLLVVLRETFPCFPCKSAFAELIAQYFKSLRVFNERNKPAKKILWFQS